MNFKSTFLSLCLVFGSYIAISQCTPDASRTTPGYYTTAGEGKMPDAQIGVAYNETITIVMFSSYLTQNVDSVILKSVDNIPSGLTYTPLSNKILGGATSCILVQGTPTDPSQVGDKKIAFQVDIHGGPGGAVKLPFTENLDLKILPKSTTSIKEITSGEFAAKLFPNPFGQKTNVVVSGISSKKISFEVFNMVGESVYFNNTIVLDANNSFEFDKNELPNGIYVYKISDGTGTSLNRMMISEK
ncbi:MAG: T9SS type A sorting domain-containing protein [Flavobacteriales bacterium]|nr:T9SS type A sorting domain-containing protein [Flavobacteriales bacterium]